MFSRVGRSVAAGFLGASLSLLGLSVVPATASAATGLASHPAARAVASSAKPVINAKATITAAKATTAAHRSTTVVASRTIKQGSGNPYSVLVGYADDLRPNPKDFPTPWAGDASAVFEGCVPNCTGWDGGAVEVVNTSKSPITIDSFTIDFSSACVYNIWPGNVSVPVGQEAIFTETETGGGSGCTVNASGPSYMDSSDIGPNGSNWAGNCTQSGIIPQVNVTVNGTAATYTDSGQVLNTGGVDGASCNPLTTNESAQWTPIGQPKATGLTLTDTPATQSVAPNGTASVTATVTNGSKTPLSGVPVTFTITSGPNAGTTATVDTGSTGKAIYTYSSSKFGIDAVQPSVSNTTGTIDGSTVLVYWQTATLTLGANTGLPGSTITYTGSGYGDGESVNLYFGSPTGTELTTVTASGTGTISGSFTVPVPSGGLPVGYVVAVGATSGKEGWALFNEACTTDWNNPAGGSFSTASDWTGGTVPGATDLACILVPGTYSVTLSGSDTVGSLIVGTTSTSNGTQTLEIPGGNIGLTLNGPSTIQASGHIDLNSTDGNYSLISGGPITNNGSFTTTEGDGNVRYIRAGLTNTSTGTVTLNDYDNRMDQDTNTVNDGTFTIAAGGGLSVTGGSGETFTQAGGSLTVNGSMYVANSTLALTGGTLSGDPVLNGSTLSAGPSKGGTITLECGDTLSGTIPKGQTVNVQGNGCGSASTTLSGTQVTNNGTLEMDSTDGNYSLINGSPLVNAGTFEAVQDIGGTRYIRVNLTNSATGKVTIGSFDTRMDQDTNTVNNGTFTVSAGAGLSVTGGSGETFTQSAGTATFSGSMYIANSTLDLNGGTVTGLTTLQSSTLTDSGTAGGTFILQCGDNLSGTIPSGQTVNIQGNGCGGASTTLTGTQVTNNGTLEMDSTDGNPSFITGSPLVNAGTFETVQDNGGTRYIRVNLTNNAGGTVTIGDYDSRMDQATTTVNNGTFTVLTGAGLSLTGGSGETFTQSGGTAAFNGSTYIANSTLDLAGGTVTGLATLQSSTLTDSGSAGGTFILQCGDSLSGTIPSGQTVNVQGNGCGGASTTLTGTSVVNDGTLEVDSTDGNSSLITGSPLENAGTVSVPADAGGTRYLRVALTNDAAGTVSISASDAVVDQNYPWVNNGAFTVASGGSFNDYGGGSFTQSGGTFTNGGSANFQSGSFTFSGGTTSGADPLSINAGSTFADNTADAGSFDFLNNVSFTTGNPDSGGNISVASGQNLVVEDNCTGQANFVASLPIDLYGALSSASAGTGCTGYNTYLTVPGAGLTVEAGASFVWGPAETGHTGTRQMTGTTTVDSGGTYVVEVGANINSSTFTNNGTVSVADGAGLNLSTGSYTNGSAATLGVVADATAGTGYGITGSGTVKAAGTLQVTTVGSPASGSSYTVVSAASLTGTFGHIKTGTTSYTPTYSATALSLTH